MCVLVVYMVIGLILNWLSIFLIYGKLIRICKNHSEIYFEAYKQGNEVRVGFDLSGYPYWAKVAITQILWPINVFNTFNCGFKAIGIAKTLLIEEANK